MWMQLLGLTNIDAIWTFSLHDLEPAYTVNTINWKIHKRCNFVSSRKWKRREITNDELKVADYSITWVLVKRDLVDSDFLQSSADCKMAFDNEMRSKLNEFSFTSPSSYKPLSVLCSRLIPVSSNALPSKIDPVYSPLASSKRPVDIRSTFAIHQAAEW